MKLDTGGAFKFLDAIAPKDGVENEPQEFICNVGSLREENEARKYYCTLTENIGQLVRAVRERNIAQAYGGHGLERHVKCVVEIHVIGEVSVPRGSKPGKDSHVCSEKRQGQKKLLRKDPGSFRRTSAAIRNDPLLRGKVRCERGARRHGHRHTHLYKIIKRVDEDTKA